MVAPFADLLALVEDRPRDAVDRALDRALLDPVEQGFQRDLPRLGKGLAARAAAKLIGAGVGHADAPARLVDAFGRGERLDEVDLLLGGPAVVARAELAGSKGMTVVVLSLMPPGGKGGGSVISNGGL